MRLSVVIVNYNVRYFLEQCLASVRRAMQGIEGEVWVVDNHSADDSVRMVQKQFPEVRLIANQNNPGFAVANNQAIRQSTGEYVLLLNPDTLVEEDTFQKCLHFMDAHPDAGALGCKLIDGSGKYLPESKRGFPSPWVAFCKTFGLSALFPHSRMFNRYYLGHLSENETHEVDVLAGCFMFMRRTALDRSGLLDEAFFMYGEDIDLSYRIVKAGFKNYYFPDTRIIHYKGESTKKGSLNYVRTFYQAMIIFSRKHFTGSRAGIFVLMLQGAIWLRAGMTLSQNFFRKIWLPLLDLILIYAGLWLVKDFWANYFYHDPDYFQSSVLWFNFPLYSLVWVISVWLGGGYDSRYDLGRLMRGLGFGTLLLLAIYGLLDLDYRPSRAQLLLGALWAAGATAGLRFVLHFKEFGNFRIGQNRTKNLLIIGSEAESNRVQEVLRQTQHSKNLIGTLVTTGPADHSLGNPDQLTDIVRIYDVNEIVFCSKDLTTNQITRWMTELGPQVSYKMVAAESLGIIGSSSPNEPGELYTVDIRYNIAQPGQRRNKRVLDLAWCIFLVITSPYWLLVSRNRALILKNWLAVFLGRRTWVSYAESTDNSSLPPLMPGVFNPSSGLNVTVFSEPMLTRLHFLYAKDWSIWRDLGILFKTLKHGI